MPLDHGAAFSLPDAHWAKDAVAALAAKGLVEGYPDGTFEGDRTASRWEVAMIVARPLRSLQRYSMDDNMSSVITPSPSLPTLNVAAGTQVGHPFSWEGLQVMSTYSLKF